jgi:folate-binding protein YgfZ
LTTQHLSGLSPRTSTEALVLSPHGHVEHDLHLVDDGEVTWVTVEPGAAPALVDWLDRMRFMLRVEVQDVTAEWAVLGEPVRRESVDGESPAWVDPWPATGAGSARYAPVGDDAHPGSARAWRERIVPRERLVDVVGDMDLAGTWAAEALRVAAWRPRFGFETDHRTIPHEVDWLRTALHLQKGCYRGQETVARVHNLGRPPRRLVMLHLDGSGHHLPARGSDVMAGDRRVGFLTTVARHHELGPVALALVKRSTPVDAELLVDGVAAAQEVVVAP